MTADGESLVGVSVLPEGTIDFVRLEAWMDGLEVGEGRIREVELLAGGTQNILVMFTRGSCRYVLRRPPLHTGPGGNEVMRREARVLDALAATDVPHARLIAACGDESVLGVAFYLMEAIDGFNATMGLPPLHACDKSVRRQMGFALVDGAAALGRINHVAVGLRDFGKPENYLKRQVDRWTSQLVGYRSNPGWPGPEELTGVALITSYLQAHCPAVFKPGIMHGDYSIGNVLYRRDGPKLAAIVDWELATIGDPVVDLAWIIATWRGAGGPDLPLLIVEPFDGFPTTEEMVARYAQQSDRDLTSLNWYIVLACFKLAVILEGTFARACAGIAPMSTGRQFHDTSIKLMQRALFRIPT